MNTGKTHHPHPVRPDTTACGISTTRQDCRIDGLLDSVTCIRCSNALVRLAVQHRPGSTPRYCGERNHRNDGLHAVWSNGKLLDPRPSLHLRSMSPKGFSWGYAGSGPAQLALAILLDYTNSAELAECLFIHFKEEVVSRIRSNRWELTSQQLDAWMRLHLHHLEPVR